VKRLLNEVNETYRAVTRMQAGSLRSSSVVVSLLTRHVLMPRPPSSRSRQWIFASPELTTAYFRLCAYNKARFRPSQRAQPPQVLGRRVGSRQQLSPRWRGHRQPADRATGLQTLTSERPQLPRRPAQRSCLPEAAHLDPVPSVAETYCRAAWQRGTRCGKSSGAGVSTGGGAGLVLQSCSRGAPVAVSGHRAGGGEPQQQHRHQPVALRAGVPVTAMDCEPIPEDRGRDAGVRSLASRLQSHR